MTRFLQIVLAVVMGALLGCSRESSAPIATAAPAKATAAVASEPAPIPMGQVTRVADAEVALASAEVLEASPAWKERSVKVTFAITNKSDVKLLHISGFTHREGPADDKHRWGFVVSDEVGNEYVGVDFPSFGNDSGNIYPGKSAERSIACGVPVDAAKGLKIALPMKNLGGEGSLTFYLPASKIANLK